MKRWEKFSKEQLQTIVDNSNTFEEVLNAVGYSTTSRGSECILKQGLNKLNIDYSKFLNTLKWTRISIKQLEMLVKESHSLTELKNKLGYPSNNSRVNQDIINYLQINNIDYFHLIPNKDEDIIVGRNSTCIRQKLIKERGNYCEQCGLSNWLNKPITLQVHHIDGNNQNNIRNNLQLLCPNCHSQTDNWSKRKADL